MNTPKQYSEKSLDDIELRWILITSARVSLVLSVLTEGGWLERHKEYRCAKSTSKRLLDVTRLYDKNGKRLEGVHSYARHRLERIGRLNCIKTGKRTIWTLRDYVSPAPF